MKRKPSLKILACFIVALIFSAHISTALAVEIPAEIKDYMKKEYPNGKFRIDGVFQNGRELFLPLYPFQETKLSDNLLGDGAESVGTVFEDLHLIQKSKQKDYLFSNGWILTPITSNTIRSLDFYEDIFREQIVKNTIIDEFIVPVGFTLPRDLITVSGHLPIKFRTVELATRKEERYLELLKKEIADANLKVFSYDLQAGEIKLSKISLRDRFAKVPEAQNYIKKRPEVENFDFDGLEENLSLISEMKIINGEIYIVDYNKSRVYKFLEDNGAFKLEEWLRAPKNHGLQDFTTSVDGSVSYLLTSKIPKLFIYDTRTKKRIKFIDMPPNPSALLNFSNNFKDNDFIVATCKGSDQVVFVGSFDHRVVEEVSVGRKPVAMAATSDYLYVANKLGKSISVVDWVTRKVEKTIDLESIPSKLLISPDSKHLFVLTPYTSKIEVIRIEDHQAITSIDLAPDLVEPNTMMISPLEYFLIVGSSDSNLVGIVDMESLELIKKVDIEGHSNKLVVLNEEAIIERD